MTQTPDFDSTRVDFDTILNNIPSINMGARSANAPLTQSYDKGPDVPLIEATIGDFFDAIVSKYPEREALVVRHQNIRWTYRELQQQVNQLASSMIEMGLEIGDRIGIWSHNNAEWLLMQLATAKVGVILVNINPAYRTFWCTCRTTGELYIDSIGVFKLSLTFGNTRIVGIALAHPRREFLHKAECLVRLWLINPNDTFNRRS